MEIGSNKIAMEAREAKVRKEAFKIGYNARLRLFHVIGEKAAVRPGAGQ